MSNSYLEWQCHGPAPTWNSQVEPLFPGMEKGLSLAEYFRSIVLVADDSPEEEGCWFTLSQGPAAADPRPRLELFFSTRSLAKPQPAKGTVFPVKQIWEAREGPWPSPAFDPQDFSLEQAEQFLFHNLLIARDLVQEKISYSSVPDGQIEAFEAAWAVVVDGRLSQLRLPGYSLANRRGKFSRLFSSAGVLMPDHWQIFQSLWDGALPTGRDVVAVLRQLPRL